MKSRQRGATAIEFALVILIFFTFFLGLLDFARLLFTWNAASEAARAGARYAVVCGATGGAGDAQVLARMKVLLPEITDIDVTWSPPSCDPTTCIGVTVTVQGLDFRWISPIAGLATPIAPLLLPQFKTFLTREVMHQDPNSDAMCS
ncbi:TadE/TadG family type IV pilus assembly protein [Ramlibacter sp.]|uniref:TadE/TadG family type IV pilus assembly protein n=1 Tax=Ramlibacter sp. TaxID=1917967 RepID=UPI002B704AC9|nr:TadE/TadG family type IV pilus assembly protein [Ramlibacter sp.]HWI81807.1 TadE/TadG family type IV pilus assembly protein [Ramlibacter sp.]